MRVLEGAVNTAFNGQTIFAENSTINQNQVTVDMSYNAINYAPYQTINPWSVSIQQNHYAHAIPDVDEIPDPNVSDWLPQGPQSSRPPRPSTPESTTKDESIEEGQGRQDKPGTGHLGTFSKVIIFLTRQVYLHLLLRLPSLYFSRVEQIFDDANLSLVEIKDLVLRSVISENKELLSRITANMESSSEESRLLPPSYKEMKGRWEHFVDGLLKEWETLSIVSALLVPSILTMFQISGAATSDPVTRYLSFWSLLSALVSLLYSCMYTIQFSRMRKAYNILEWGLEMQARQWVFWDVVIMLAMPVLWLTWSIVSFIACIVWFMWRAPTQLPNNFPVSKSTEFGFRIFICTIIGIATIYGVLILNTFKRYGTSMRVGWKKRAKKLIKGFQPLTSTPNNSMPLPSSMPQRGSNQHPLGSMPSPNPFIIT